MPLPEDVPAVHRPAASVLAMQQIQQWIEDGTLQPGEVLKDTEIAAKLGVSRTPIREAFQRLELLGLVVSTRSTRTEVAPARPQDAELLYVPLSVLHELAVQLALGNLRDEDFETMTAANERLREAAERGDAVATRQADEEFHAVLLERTGNPFLVQVIDWLSVHSRRLNTSTSPRTGRPRTPTRITWRSSRRCATGTSRAPASSPATTSCAPSKWYSSQSPDRSADPGSPS